MPPLLPRAQEEEEEEEVEAARVPLLGRLDPRCRMRLTTIASSAEKASSTACPRSCPCKLRLRPSRAPRGCSRGTCRAGLQQKRRRQRRWNADVLRRRHQATPTPTTPIERMLRRLLPLLLRRGSAPGRSSLPRPLRRSPSLLVGCARKQRATREREKLGAREECASSNRAHVFFFFFFF